MKLLRVFLVSYAILSIIGAVLLFQHTRSGWYLLIVCYLLINAFIILVGIIFEKNRYEPKSGAKVGWRPTNERFIDQSSGKLMEVYYNPKTGERKYQEVNSKIHDGI